jgi:hypothetical protein
MRLSKFANADETFRLTNFSEKQRSASPENGALRIAFVNARSTRIAATRIIY